MPSASMQRALDRANAPTTRLRVRGDVTGVNYFRAAYVFENWFRLFVTVNEPSRRALTFR
jgi:hypothetical protein